MSTIGTATFSVHEILPGQLYQRSKMHDLSPDAKATGLRALGVSRVVALAPRSPDPDLATWAQLGAVPPPAQSALLDARNGDPLHFQYRHRPIPDGRLDDAVAEFLLAEARLLAKKIRLGFRVMTSCNAGRNRSGLLSALVVRELTGQPGAWCLGLVRERRPRAVDNRHFEAFLLKLGSPPDFTSNAE